MEIPVASLRFAILAGIVSFTSAGGPYYPYDGCLGELGWVHFGDYCYKFITPVNGLPYDEVETLCKEDGPWKWETSSYLTYLADVQSQAENDFILQELKKVKPVLEENEVRRPAWLGARRVGDSFQWTVNDQSLAFANWKPNEPNNHNGDEDCIEFNRGITERWNDLKCRRKRWGVCKYSISEWAAGRKIK